MYEYSLESILGTGTGTNNPSPQHRHHHEGGQQQQHQVLNKSPAGNIREEALLTDGYVTMQDYEDSSDTLATSRGSRMVRLRGRGNSLTSQSGLSGTGGGGGERVSFSNAYDIAGGEDVDFFDRVWYDKEQHAATACGGGVANVKQTLHWLFFRNVAEWGPKWFLWAVPLALVVLLLLEVVCVLLLLTEYYCIETGDPVSSPDHGCSRQGFLGMLFFHPFGCIISPCLGFAAVVRNDHKIGRVYVSWNLVSFCNVFVSIVTLIDFADDMQEDLVINCFLC